jgi:hypothetical protein
MILSILRRLSVEPHNSPRPRIPETLPPKVRNKLRKAIQEQAAIRWSLTLQGYLAKLWTNAYCRLSGNEIESDTTKKWSSTVINCLWTYAFSMWKLRCQILHDDNDGLKFTKLDNEIRALYLEKDTFLPVDRNLFSLPLARVLAKTAKTAKTKEAHLLGFQAAKQRLEAFNDPDNLENIINPANRRKRKKYSQESQETQASDHHHHEHYNNSCPHQASSHRTTRPTHSHNAAISMPATAKINTGTTTTQAPNSTHRSPPTVSPLLSYYACLTTNQTHHCPGITFLFVWPSSSWSSMRVESKIERRTLKQLNICYLFIYSCGERVVLGRAVDGCCYAERRRVCLLLHAVQPTSGISTADDVLLRGWAHANRCD